MTSEFLGYNHNLQIGEGEFYDMKNMTSDHYPVLAPRKKRGTYFDTTRGGYASGLIDKDGLCYIDSTELVLSNGDRVEMQLDELEGDALSTRKMISMGSYIIILPEKKWVNTVKKDGAVDYDWGYIEHSETSIGGVRFRLCTQDGVLYGPAHPNWKAPQNPEDGTLWIDTSSVPSVLKRYSEDQSMWVIIPTTYVIIESQGIGRTFSKHDGVKISGFTAKDAKSLNGYHTLWNVDPQGDYIIVTGIIDEDGEQEENITISREMPIMDHIIECNNRLWGCRYGANSDGEIVNEIYASKQGDFKNWFCYMQISTDSFTQSVGSDGPFTGAINHGGYPIFFKENCMHKVYGSIPANFQVQTTPCRGVQKGSHKSLAIVNETLFYKSANAVCAYDGSLPVEVSSALGDARYSDAVACAYGNKYYISMKDVSGNYSLFVYDTAKGMWHKEDDLRVAEFCSCTEEIYAIDYKSYGDVITLLNSAGTKENNVPWMVETGLIGMFMPDMKYISKILIRMSLDAGSSINVSIQYDSSGDWEYVCSMSETSLRSFSVPIRPRRCDHFRIRIEGVGDGRIYSITKTIEQGSDRS
jgi:hypothetical protein